MTAILVGVGLVSGACVAIVLVALAIEQLIRDYNQRRGVDL